MKRKRRKKRLNVSRVPQQCKAYGPEPALTISFIKEEGFKLKLTETGRWFHRREASELKTLVPSLLSERAPVGWYGAMSSLRYDGAIANLKSSQTTKMKQKQMIIKWEVINNKKSVWGSCVPSCGFPPASITAALHPSGPVSAPPPPHCGPSASWNELHFLITRESQCGNSLWVHSNRGERGAWWIAVARTTTSRWPGRSGGWDTG